MFQNGRLYCTKQWCETFVDQAGHLLLRRAARYIGVGVINYVSRKYQPRSAIVQRYPFATRAASIPRLDVIAFIILAIPLSHI